MSDGPDIDLTDHRTSRPLRSRPRRPLFWRDLPFPITPNVRWFRPRVALSAGYRALAAAQLGMFLDKREMQAHRPQRIFDASTDYDELWFDHVADTGDGFDGTYSVLSAVGAETLTVELPDGTSTELPRSDLLVFGGDEVYPTATVAEYERRLIGPLLSAFPWTDLERPPRLFAIPGNHDWYDGLTSFLRTFTQPDRAIGGWELEQTRSYFAIEMPHGWKLWGIDISLDNYIDSPQMEYFSSVPLGEGDRVVMATPVPAWVKEARTSHGAPDDSQGGSHRRVGDNLRYFERKTIGESKARLAATISGDLHHYARYEGEISPPDADTSDPDSAPQAPIQRITAGGGGAFLYPTHQLPDSLEFADPSTRDPIQYDLAERYPDAGTSRRIALFGQGGPFALIRRNPRFSFVMAGVSLVIAALIVVTTAWWSGTAFLWDAGFTDLLIHAVLPPSGLVTLAMLAAGVLIAEPPPQAPSPRIARLAAGLAHGAAQMLGLITVLWLGLKLLPGLDLSSLDASAVDPATDGRTALWVTLLLIGVAIVGGLLSTFIFGLYLTISCGVFGGDPNLSFSAKRIEDNKCFLRCHITRDGDLEIWPLAIDRARTDWGISASSDARHPWIVSRGQPDPVARLIEPPIVIPGGRRPTPDPDAVAGDAAPVEHPSI